jgi:hypothetical protein
MTRPSFPYDVLQFFLSDDEPAPETDPRPALTEAWANAMNDYPERESQIDWPNGLTVKRT